MANETLYVNAFDATTSGWGAIGSSPYLDDSDDFLYEHNDGNNDSWFAFANSGVGAGVINSVILYGHCKLLSAGSELIKLELDVGGGAVNVGTFNPTTDAFEWYTIDVSATVDTWAKIDACVAKITCVNDGDYRYIDRMYLYIDYTAGGGLSIPVAMNQYGIHINKKIRGG